LYNDSNDGDLIIPKNKVRVYDYIKNQPGSHLRKISKELNMTPSDAQYWCNRLEKTALVRSRRLGLYKTYYPASILGERHEYILAILQQKTPRIIVLYLIENSGASQRDIAQHTGFAAATISWHMSRLIEFGLVYSSKKGKFVKYYIRGDIADLVIVLRSYYPSIWDFYGSGFGLGGYCGNCGYGFHNHFYPNRSDYPFELPFP
jgi:predicted transcriptional regulator